MGMQDVPKDDPKFDRPLKIKREHPHSKMCESFNMALDYGHLIVIQGELQIQGRLPKGAKTGNIITGEKYDPETFHFNMVIHFCPFCGKNFDEAECAHYRQELENEGYFEDDPFPPTEGSQRQGNPPKTFSRPVWRGI